MAGLSAALELADRGYHVTIKEKMVNSVGGKLATRPLNVLNQTFYVEHGFHGKNDSLYLSNIPLLNLVLFILAWFGTYHQFKDIRDRLNINSYFKSWPAVALRLYIYKILCL